MNLINNLPILSFLIFFPIISAIFVALLRLKDEKKFLNLGIIFSITNFLISLILLLAFNKQDKFFQFTETIKIFSFLDIKYMLGVDGLSLLMVILTTFLVPICFLISYNSVKNRVKEFVIYFLLLEGFVIGSFLALDLILFYIFFEIMLIPMFLIIGIWGGENRIYASYKFFLYTLFGSLFFLLAIIYIIINFSSTDYILLSQILPNLISANIQKVLWLGFFISFAIKVPMFPFHTWLPDAHVQAPTSGSVILAGILIKLGAYGFLRYSLPLFPYASIYFSQTILILSVIAIIYASFIALMQTDMKKMIAYSSVAHMGFVTMGIFSFTKQGIDGAIFQMISHGIVSAALFICVGCIYDRIKTKEIAKMGGIANIMPNFALIAMILTLASVGLPGTSGFVGEFLTIIGTFKSNNIIAILAALGVIFGACYMLWLYKRVWFGEISNEKISTLADLNKAEFIALASLTLLVIIFGIFPNLLMSFFHNPVDVIYNSVNNFINCFK